MAFDDIEFIEIDDSDFSEVEKLYNSPHYNFPVISVSEQTCYFNRAAAGFVPANFKWRFNTNWCVIVPCNKDDTNSYSSQRNNFGVSCRLPAGLRTEAKLSRGVRKLYKTSNGLAFKRYELVTDAREL